MKLTDEHLDDLATALIPLLNRVAKLNPPPKPDKPPEIEPTKPRFTIPELRAKDRM